MSETPKGGLGTYIGQAWLILLLAVIFGCALAGVELALRDRIKENKIRKTYDNVPKLVANKAFVKTEEFVVGQQDGKPVKIYHVLTAESKKGDYSHFGWTIPIENDDFQAKLDMLRGKTKESVDVVFGVKLIEEKKIYKILDAQGDIQAWILPGKGSGYADVIELIIAVDATGDTVLGMSVLKQAETPALGDRISKREFQSNFTKGLTTTGRPITVVKGAIEANPMLNQIQAITGATVSSKSVSEIVNKTVASLKPFIQEQGSK
jgi:electron transport complex protein RnfG